MDLDLLVAVLSIVVIDLVLSSDNAVVIGMAARRLPPIQRRRAIVLGGGAAVVLRILFTALAALLLGVPFLQFIGGFLLVWIAIKLLRGEEEHSEGNIREGKNLREAVQTIVLADVVMSLDNILAVGGASHGNLWLLLFGLLLSIPILLLGSSFVAHLMNRFPWLVWVGAGILAWTAGHMIVEDPLVHGVLEGVPVVSSVIPGFVILFVVVVALLLNRRSRDVSVAVPGHSLERPPSPRSETTK